MNRYHYIDPIVVKETQQRQAAYEDRLRTGRTASHALLWFAEYGQGAKDLKPVRVEVVAYAVPGAGEATYYLNEAAKKFRNEIIEHAVNMAKHDLKQAEAIRAI